MWIDFLNKSSNFHSKRAPNDMYLDLSSLCFIKIIMFLTEKYGIFIPLVMKKGPYHKLSLAGLVVRTGY